MRFGGRTILVLEWGCIQVSKFDSLLGGLLVHIMSVFNISYYPTLFSFYGFRSTVFRGDVYARVAVLRKRKNNGSQVKRRKGLKEEGYLWGKQSEGFVANSHNHHPPYSGSKVPQD